MLDIAHLEVQRGEVLCVVGPTGSGKSTLLRLLNFLEPPTSGTIWFWGGEYGKYGKYGEYGEYVTNGKGFLPLIIQRRITMVFQRPLLLNTSVYGNVAYGLKLRGVRDIHERVKDVLERLQLTELVRQPAKTLSGGELQRTAIARALVLEPEVLLLDEPTANLDPFNVGLIESLVAEVNRERGTTIVLVTHNVFQARRLAHRVALLLDGRIVEVSDVQAFFNNPCDPRTAAFVRGEMVY